MPTTTTTTTNDETSARIALTVQRYGMTYEELGAAMASVERRFGHEYSALAALDALAVCVDWHLIERDEDRDNYARNIGRGNLESYARTVSVWVYAAAR